jgi:ribonuclease G
MSSSSIIVDVSLGQTRVAVIEDSDLVEIYVEDNKHSSMVGNIYKGKEVVALEK